LNFLLLFSKGPISIILHHRNWNVCFFIYTTYNHKVAILIIKMLK